MINLYDNEWLGYDNGFNVEDFENRTYKVNKNKIVFNTKIWKDYVLERRLEITCGEAPFIVSRYDTSNGDLINIENRVGILDRKLRIINENVSSKDEWEKGRLKHINLYMDMNFKVIVC